MTNVSYPIVHCIRVKPPTVLRVLVISAVRKTEECFSILARHLVDFSLDECFRFFMVLEDLIRNDNQWFLRQNNFSRIQFPEIQREN